jgi:hypothetical protein
MALARGAAFLVAAVGFSVAAAGSTAPAIADAPSLASGVAAAGARLRRSAEPEPKPELPTFVESHLPIPAVPDVAYSETPVALAADDPAGEPARAIQRRVRQFPNLRAQTPGASWSADPRFVWQVRPARACLRALRDADVPFRHVERELPTPVPVPVVITGEVRGVRFRVAQSDRELELSCEMAARLPALARLLTQHGVEEVVVVSSYRDQPQVSFHTFGLALDMAAFMVDGRMLSVARHFEQTPEVETCGATPASAEGRVLLGLACALAESGMFASVLTPNYNAGHRDHFHVDVRPDDPRHFVR